MATRLRKYAYFCGITSKTTKTCGERKGCYLGKDKEMMKNKFLPQNHRHEAFLAYHNLSKKTMLVEEVIHEFNRLKMRCDVVEEEEQVIARFFRGTKTRDL